MSGVTVRAQRTFSAQMSMDEEHARWLMAVVQNPFRCELDEEPAEERQMRQDFFEALQGAINGARPVPVDFYSKE